MDVDAFVADRAPHWDRLEKLTQQRQLSGEEADMLVQLYQSAAADLSQLRSAAPDPSLLTRLSTLIAAARSKMDGTMKLRGHDIVRYFTVAIPLAFYRIRHLTWFFTFLFIAVGGAYAVWVVNTPEALAAIGPESMRRQYAEEAFASYYSDYPAPDFAAQVWTNNAWIAAQAIAGGITGIFPLYILIQNAVNVGQGAAIMAEFGYLDVFFGLILPHGFMELTAIFVATAAGFKLFLAWAIPTQRTRVAELASQGRQLMPTVIGLAIVLGVSGLVEGFVTPSSLPGALKIVIGALVLLAYWVYVYTWGRRAYREGLDGDARRETIGATVAMVG